jgi:hypothetical protein
MFRDKYCPFGGLSQNYSNSEKQPQQGIFSFVLLCVSTNELDRYIWMQCVLKSLKQVVAHVAIWKHIQSPYLNEIVDSFAYVQLRYPWDRIKRIHRSALYPSHSVTF